MPRLQPGERWGGPEGQGTGAASERRCPALASALVDLSHDANETGQPASFYPLRPHLEAALPAVDAAGLEQAGALWNNLGSHLRVVADFSRARAAYERALAIGERALRIFQAALPPDHPHIRLVRDWLASLS